MNDEGTAGTMTLSADGVSRDRGVELVVVEQRSLTRHALPAGRSLYVGRGEDCDVVLRDPGASRHHALLHVGADLSIEDLASRNGTHVGGVRSPPRQRTPLRPGDSVQIGHAVLVVQRRVASDSFAPPAAPSSPSPPASVRSADAKMRAVYELVACVAPTHLTVLVTGETGVGKELVAEAIHRLSGPRSREPFLRVNCAALAPALVESELFGHERGAFTGASREKPGLFEAAHRGTVFLDEVGELPFSTQAKLLRVLETKEVVRVGSVKMRRVDVRFIAATNRDLLAEVAGGRFREDLYFRLGAAKVWVPPLRERPSDIEPLAVEFARSLCKELGRDAPTFTASAIDRLRTYRWPGNIRELRNTIECAVLQAQGPYVDAQDLPHELTRGPSEPPGATRLAVEADTRPPPLPPGIHLSEAQRAERERIVAALAACHGNQTRAAERLGTPRRTLVAKLAAYGIPRPRTAPQGAES